MTSVPDEFWMIAPDDWHVHLREVDQLQFTVPFTSAQFGRALAMPNLGKPLITPQDGLRYLARVRAATPHHLRESFQPYVALYLHSRTHKDHPRIIAQENGDSPVTQENGTILGWKWYPKGATTGSAAGVSDIETKYDVLEAMQREGVPLMVHGEVVDDTVDVFDLERVFVDTTLTKLVENFPNLKITLEHVTTKEAVEFVKAHDSVVATVTPQHLLDTRNAIFKGGLQPHYYCLPLLKCEEDRQALLDAVTISNNRKFFAGTDSAPHLRTRKETACGCAGCFTAPYAMSYYAEAFWLWGQANPAQNAGIPWTRRLEIFASLIGAAWYGLEKNPRAIRMSRMPVKIPESIYGESAYTPYRAGETLQWSITGCKQSD